MNSIKLAGVVLVLSVATALATDSLVTWNISVPNGLTPGVDNYFDFFVNVEVTGDNQGLASFEYDLMFSKFVDGQWQTIDVHPTFTWGSYYAASRGYKSPATTLCGTVIESALQGGTGLGSGYADPGNTYHPGIIDGVRAGVLVWDALRQDGKVWAGVNQWGVGLDSRKAALLNDPAGPYMINHGYWSLADLGPEPFYLNGNKLRIEVVPVAASVLRSEVDLNVSPTNFSQSVDGMTGDVWYSPEPTTLLLLVAAAPLLRRRRDATP
ncbi:MAG: hypothetical protein JXA69_16835 [Phycisphaerae bacterium]|nr:hypothetical protein [Phycisphaerae bacterium]